MTWDVMVSSNLMRAMIAQYLSCKKYEKYSNLDEFTYILGNEISKEISNLTDSGPLSVLSIFSLSNFFELPIVVISEKGIFVEGGDKYENVFPIIVWFQPGHYMGYECEYITTNPKEFLKNFWEHYYGKTKHFSEIEAKTIFISQKTFIESKIKYLEDNERVLIEQFNEYCRLSETFCSDAILMIEEEIKEPQKELQIKEDEILARKLQEEYQKSLIVVQNPTTPSEKTLFPLAKKYLLAKFPEFDEQVAESYLQEFRKKHGQKFKPELERELLVFYFRFKMFYNDKDYSANFKEFQNMYQHLKSDEIYHRKILFDFLNTKTPPKKIIIKKPQIQKSTSKDQLEKETKILEHILKEQLKKEEEMLLRIKAEEQKKLDKLKKSI